MLSSQSYCQKCPSEEWRDKGYGGVPIDLEQEIEQATVRGGRAGVRSKNRCYSTPIAGFN